MEGNPVNSTDPSGLLCGTGACVGIAWGIGVGVGIVSTWWAANNTGKPGWWPDDVPHPSDKPADTNTECPVNNPPPLDEPRPQNECGRIAEAVGNACRSLGGSPRVCAALAIKALIACIALGGAGGMGF